MIVEIALATRSAPADWWGEDDATLATAIAVLDQMYGQRKGRRR